MVDTISLIQRIGRGCREQLGEFTSLNTITWRKQMVLVLAVLIYGIQVTRENFQKLKIK